MILDRKLDDLENSYRRRRRREKFEMVNFLSSHLRASLNRAPPAPSGRVTSSSTLALHKSRGED